MSPDKPRLSREAQIIPHGEGWLVKSPAGTSTVECPLPALEPRAFLDLLDGTRNLQSLAADTGAQPVDLSRLIKTLSELGLIADGPGPQVMADEPAPRLQTPGNLAPDAMRMTVLIVGLGELGLAVLAELSRFGEIELHVFDPIPVQPVEVHPFYLTDELGRDKASVIKARLDNTSPGRVRTIATTGTSRAAIETDVSPVLGDMNAVVSCMDQPGGMMPLLSDLCRKAGVPMVAAELTMEGGIVSSSFGRDVTDLAAGCPICVSFHQADRDPFTAALWPYLAACTPFAAPWRFSHSPADIAMFSSVAALAAIKAYEVSAGRRPHDSNVLTVSFSDWGTHTEAAAKHHACALCFPFPQKTPEQLRKDILRWWADTHPWQAITLPAELRTLQQRLQLLCGNHYGLFDSPRQITPVRRQAIWQFFRERETSPGNNIVANARTAVIRRRSAQNGNSAVMVSEYLDFKEQAAAETVGIIEGLERLFAMSYGEPHRVVLQRYSDIASRTPNPNDYPLFAEHQYHEQDFPLRRFDPDAVVPWVWGMDILNEEPVLVPRDLVYDSPSRDRIYKITSNGAACHSSLTHAILNAVYEIVERDALMVTWLNRLSMPVVRHGPSDPDPWGVRKTFEALDLELTHVDITTDFDIPVLLGVLRDHRNPDFFLVNMVASLDPGKLLAKLYRELVQFCYPYFINRRHFISDITSDPDPNHVVTFRDHLCFYQNREKNRHAGFLTDAAASCEFGEGPYATRTLDTGQELTEVLDRLSGYRPIVVDCTTPLLKTAGLHAIRVLIPGLQPLNAGFRFRVLGGERLFSIPRILGITDRDTTMGELNPWPHPFW